MLSLYFSNIFFLIIAGGAHDEGFDGPLPVSGDGGELFEGEGRDDRGGVGGVVGLEGGPEE